MEPEKDFLDNAVTMVTFAKKEINQFLTWTGKRTDYRASAEELASELSVIIGRIKKLKENYENRL